MFKPPKMPAPQAPPRAPTVDQAVINTERQDMLRRRKGAASTFMSTEQGRASGSAAAKALMGQGG